MDYTLTPKYLDDFIYHENIIKRLKLTKDEKIINSIFIGLNNSGKKTLINAYLNFMFQTDIHCQKKLCKYELKIVELENDLKRIQKQLDNLCY